MRGMLWNANEDGSVNCNVCAHGCKIKNGGQGICGVRVNRDGELRTLVGDLVTAVNMDPVEKKPLYHFLPGTKTFSIGSAGCNFGCKFCQNHNVAAVSPKSVIPGKRVSPESLARLAEENGAPSMAFTYNEPTVYIEQVYATAGQAKARGMKTILVTNGFFSHDALMTLSRRIDAANIDLKGMNDDFYRHYCGGRLQPVLDNLLAAKKLGWWVEVTTLLIPGVNDDPKELAKIAAFIKNDLGPETPWHISGFHGANKMINHPSTPLKTLENAWQTGKDAGLHNVYIGNAPGLLGQNTFCPNCGQTLVERSGYSTRVLAKKGVCPKCKTQMAGVIA